MTKGIKLSLMESRNLRGGKPTAKSSQSRSISGFNSEGTKGQKRIKVAYLIDFLATRDGITGGTEKQLLELITRLDVAKVAPILFVLQKFQHLHCWDAVSTEKHLLHMYSLGNIRSAWKLLLLMRFLRKEQVDIVQTFFHDATVFGILAGWLAHVPIRISCRRDLGFWHGAQVPKGLKFVNLLTTRFLANCEAVRQHMIHKEKLRAERIDVIRNGIDAGRVDRVIARPLAVEYANVGESDAIVGIVANYNRHVKRVDLFVQAASIVVRQYPNAKFAIIGGGSLQNGLKKMACDLGIEKAVIFCGNKCDPIPYIKDFDIGVITSDSEGLSNTILEYMACGIPTIATNAGGNAELVRAGYTGLLIPPGNAVEIASGICRLLNHGELRRDMGHHAREVVLREYDWSVTSKKVESYYFGLLNCVQ